MTEQLGKQEQRVLDYISNHQSINLKQKGYEIESNRKTSQNRFGEDVRFAEYSLGENK